MVGFCWHSYAWKNIGFGCGTCSVVVTVCVVSVYVEGTTSVAVIMCDIMGFLENSRVYPIAKTDGILLKFISWLVENSTFVQKIHLLCQHNSLHR